MINVNETYARRVKQTIPTRSKGNLKCSDEKSLHASNSCPKYVVLSPLDRTIALDIILCCAMQNLEAIQALEVEDCTYLTSLGEVVIPTLMLEAPLSRTTTGARFIM
jgi:hypothetical protein